MSAGLDSGLSTQDPGLYNAPRVAELRLLNTLSREKDAFVHLTLGEVRMFSSVPTVYNQPHIGNRRTFLWSDLLRRYLAWRGYRVTQVINITDVDDKIIRKAAAADRKST